MSYRSIMVHMDQSQAALKRVRLAKGLAEAMDAHLIGLSAAAALSDAALVGGLPPAFLEERAAQLRDCCTALGDHFFSIAGGRSAEWRAELGQPDVVLSDHARAADLVVVGRAGPVEAGQEFHLSPASALMKALVRVRFSKSSTAVGATGMPRVNAWASVPSFIAAVGSLPCRRA